MASQNCFGQNNRGIPQNLLRQIKMKFPEFSEQYIEELLIKFGGDVEHVTMELNAISNQFMYGQNLNEIQPMVQRPSQDHMHRHPQLDRNHPLMMNSPNYNMHASMYPMKDMSRNLSPEQMMYFNDRRLHSMYNVNQVRMPSPSDLFLQRRTISDDSLTFRRQVQEFGNRDRAISDVSDTTTMSRKNHHESNFPAPFMHGYGQPFMQTSKSPEMRPNQMENHAEEGSHLYHIQEENRYTPTQHLQIQIESYTRMYTKVKALEEEVDRIRRQVQQEEDDINTSSKVQKNPTKEDVERLRGEILVLNGDIIKADNELEKIKAEGTASASTTPSLSPYQMMATEDLRSAMNAPISSPSSFSDTTPPRPHLSAPRFPHPIQCDPMNPQMTPSFNPNNIFNRQTTVTPPPNYNDIVNPIGDMQPRESDGTEDQWECVACTFKNHAELPDCEVCGEARVRFV